MFNVTKFGEDFLRFATLSVGMQLLSKLAIQASPHHWKEDVETYVHQLDHPRKRHHPKLLGIGVIKMKQPPQYLVNLVDD